MTKAHHPAFIAHMVGWARWAIAGTIVASSVAHTPAAADEDAERAQLQKSLLGACKSFDSEREWAALDKCNRAWFHDHERAVWQLNLNPHGKPSAKPSS